MTIAGAVAIEPFVFDKAALYGSDGVADDAKPSIFGIDLGPFGNCFPRGSVVRLPLRHHHGPLTSDTGGRRWEPGVVGADIERQERRQQREPARVQHRQRAGNRSQRQRNATHQRQPR